MTITSSSKSVHLFVALTFAALTAACAEEPGVDAAARFCERADSCNRLNTSADECVAAADRCLQDLTTPQREDWARMVDACLGFSTCDATIDCYFATVMWC